MPEATPNPGPLGRLEGTRFTDVRFLDEVDSTNRYLLDEARRGAPEGVVAVADHQSAGRGRLGRSWEAPPGSSLLVSVLLRPELPLESIPLVTMAAGLAACDAVWLVAGFTPGLKWPNDLVVGGRKLAGLLAEADLGEGRARALVLGMGLNVVWAEFPPELAETATACNLEAGHDVDRVELLVAWLRRFEARLADLHHPRGAGAVLGEYRQRCVTLGRRVRVERGSGSVVSGTAVDVTDRGHLLVEGEAGGVVEVSVGDVVHVR